MIHNKKMSTTITKEVLTLGSRQALEMSGCTGVMPERKTLLGSLESSGATSGCIEETSVRWGYDDHL